MVADRCNDSKADETCWCLLVVELFLSSTVCPEGSVGAEDEERESLFFYLFFFFFLLPIPRRQKRETGFSSFSPLLRLLLSNTTVIPADWSSPLFSSCFLSFSLARCPVAASSPAFFSVVSWSDGVVRGGSGGHGRVGEGSLALRSRRQQTQGQPSQPSPVSQPPFSFYRRRKTFFIPIVPLEALSSSSAPSFKIFHGLRARTTFDPFCSTFFLKSSAVVPTTNVTEVAKLEQGRLGFSKAFSLKWPQLKKYHYNRL